MKLYPQTVCQLAFLSLCVLISVRESDSTFIPGRCLCPETRPAVRGQIKALVVQPESPSCAKVTVIVTLRSNNEPVCVDPEGPMGKQLIRCYKRTQKMGRDVKLCLRRRRKAKGGRRFRGHGRRASSSGSQ